MKNQGSLGERDRDSQKDSKRKFGGMESAASAAETTEQSSSLLGWLGTLVGWSSAASSTASTTSPKGAKRGGKKLVLG